MFKNALKRVVSKSGYKAVFNVIKKDMNARLEFAKKRKNRILIDNYRNALNLVRRLSDLF